MAKTALGRGLGALLGGAPSHTAPAGTPPAAGPPAAQVLQIAPDQIRPCPFQPRKEFAPEALQELADSIREQGVVQPLIVRSRGEHFELIAGERRWRAAQMAGLSTVPVVVRETDDANVLELAMVENLQREDLNPLEEALGFEQLLGQFNLTQDQVATKVGRSRAAVANALRLLRLPLELQTKVKSGALSVGHAKVLLGLQNPDEQMLLAQKILAEGLNVRQTERFAAALQKRGGQGPVRSSSPRPGHSGVHTAAVEERLKQHLGTKVFIRYADGQGSIDIRFFSDDDLNRLLEVIGLPLD